jgi:carbon-monoxide dehydrogenase medium subunit
VTRFEYHKPHTIKEAIALMGSLENAKFIAGGTDVMVLIRQKKIAPAHLVSLRNITDFSSLDTREGLQIGGGAATSAMPPRLRTRPARFWFSMPT